LRQIVEQVQVSPTNGKYRVFIIDEVHMLTPSAFNAFLKTLEEPPSYVVFILATTEKHKIIPTILSRCQIYDFNRITVSDMVDHLAYVAEQEGIEAERAGLQVIARKADGAMRDALSIFDQVAASSNRHITYASTIENLNVLDQAYYGKLVKAFMDKNVEQALLIYKEILDHGFDSHHFINGLAGYVRDLMVARAEATATLVDTDDETRRDMAELAAQVPVEFFYDAMSLCNEADLNYRVASSKTFLVELLLIRLCQLLGPSPTYSGAGEGQLYPIAASQQPQAAPRQASAQTQKAAPQTYPRQQVPAQPSQPTQRAAAYPAQSARPTTQPAQAYSAPASTSTAPPPQRSAAP
ncbi:MAG: DNA polymerase III subunit gamma/tau, partial [Muribaculaceae bacterium]|nr:DNA polymerase III subunit gamma/tau [Muribaculaceae bacterium]